jgi:hypothetical protein
MGSDPAGSESEIPKFFRCILEHMYFFGPLVALDGSDSVAFASARALPRWPIVSCRCRRAARPRFAAVGGKI